MLTLLFSLVWPHPFLDNTGSTSYTKMIMNIRIKQSTVMTLPLLVSLYF